jgi:hypothetical protein
MKFGWGCGDQLTAHDARALHNMREAARSPDHVARRRRNLNAKRGCPPVPECRAVALQSPTQSEPDARALRDMREGAGGLRRRGVTDVEG